MTTELTKAAQQALEALKHGVAQLNGIGIPLEADPLHMAIAALERALTHRPAAQGVDERVAFEVQATLESIIKQYRIKAADAHWLRASLPAQPAAQATRDQFAAASNMVAPVALRSVHLTRDTAGMCVVRINGRVAIRDNGDIIDHMATLEWFADTQQATPEPEFDDCSSSPTGKHSESWFGNGDCDHCKTGAQNAPMIATPEPLTSFDDPRAQIVYDLLCSDEAPPPEQHWEGWVARRIVDALAATPEPVGEAAAWQERQTEYVSGTFGRWYNCTGPSPRAAMEDGHLSLTTGGITYQWRPLYTRPAPGVPEGLPAVLTDWGFDVHDDEEGRTWLTIRNPDDDVARMSVPTVWPLNGNQTISAVVLHQFSAALTSALAAAQAKGEQA